jgi:hypothetical protein
MTGERDDLPATLPVFWALETALGELPEDTVQKRDRAAEALARRYARDIDDAQVISSVAAKVLRALARENVDIEVYDRVAALFDRIESTAVLALLGPKLLVVLTELGMTPKSRADVTHKGGKRGDRGNAGQSDFAKLRAARMAGLKAP